LDNQVANARGILFKAQPFRDVKLLQSVSFSIIYSQLQYVILAWGTCNRTALYSLG